ncbi:MAG: CCA tRNA nucleotidyltransferase [Firmicutes bacterium]|nr:CCA tRNA nucleotidyltransferase [Bacillota bacterium]
MQRIMVPENVGLILKELEQHGFEAYIVGGCVRDSVMGHAPKDWDITTSAKPQDVKKIFRNTYDTGIEHGTVSVRLGTETYEVTTFRVDGQYTDHRRPDSVQFTQRLAEDLKRRDFTMNAMAWHPRTGLVDLFGGCEDIRAGRIRCVGDPMERFEEDALRMLRAYRFAARFGFLLDQRTELAISRKAPLLANVSQERIREELDQLICSEHPGLLRQVYKSGLLQQILPEWQACDETPQHTPYHLYTVGEHLIRTAEAAPCDRVVRWAALLHDIGKPACRTTDAQGTDHFKGHDEVSARMADTIMRRLKFDNETRHAVVTAVACHDNAFPEDEREMRILLNRLPDGFYPYLQALQRADAAARNPQYLQQSLDQLDRAEELYRKIIREGHCYKLADLAVTGNDLIRLGFRPGRRIGQILQELLRQVLDHPELNQRELLLQVAEALPRQEDPAAGDI